MLDCNNCQREDAPCEYCIRDNNEEPSFTRVDLHFNIKDERKEDN